MRPGHASCRAALSTTCLGFSWLLDLASAVSLAAPPRARFPLFCGLVCFTVTEFSSWLSSINTVTEFSKKKKDEKIFENVLNWLYSNPNTVSRSRFGGR